MTQPFVLSLYFDDVRKLGLHGAVGLGAGIAAAVALQLTCGLYFWNEDQQQAQGTVGASGLNPRGFCRDAADGYSRWSFRPLSVASYLSAPHRLAVED